MKLDTTAYPMVIKVVGDSRCGEGSGGIHTGSTEWYLVQNELLVEQGLNDQISCTWVLHCNVMSYFMSKGDM